jgi:hypothetical protein
MEKDPVNLKKKCAASIKPNWSGLCPKRGRLPSSCFFQIGKRKKIPAQRKSPSPGAAHRAGTSPVRRRRRSPAHPWPAAIQVILIKFSLELTRCYARWVQMLTRHLMSLWVEIVVNLSGLFFPISSTLTAGSFFIFVGNGRFSYVLLTISLYNYIKYLIVQIGWADCKQSLLK